MSQRHGSRTWPGALALLLMATQGLARQEAPPPPPEAQPLPRPAPNPIKPLGSAPERPATPRANEGAIPGLEQADFRIAPAPLRAEGTFLVEQRATMIRLAGGERIVVFHEDPSGKRERPMVLMPCQKLQQMEQMAADRGKTPVFIVSGQVFAYLGVNHLLPTVARILAQPATPTTPEQPAQPLPANPINPAADPAVQDLIKELETQREATRSPEGVVRTDSRPAETAREGESPTIAEGEPLLRRRGRITRLSGGEWAFSMDNGPSADARMDRPLIVQPCLTLQRMEQWSAQRGEAASFEVSGRIMAYQGKNYLMPTMFQVYPATDLEARH